MRCKNHIDQVAIEKCASCGAWFCDDCISISEKKPYCNICLGIKTPVIKKTASTPIYSEKYEKEIIASKIDFNPRAKVVSERLSQVGYTGIVEDYGSAVDTNSRSEIIKHNNKIKKEMMSNDKYTITQYEQSSFRKKTIRKAVIGTVLVALANPFTVVVGMVLLATAVIDFFSYRKKY